MTTGNNDIAKINGDLGTVVKFLGEKIDGVHSELVVLSTKHDALRSDIEMKRDVDKKDNEQKHAVIHQRINNLNQQQAVVEDRTQRFTRFQEWAVRAIIGAVVALFVWMIKVTSGG